MSRDQGPTLDGVDRPIGGGMKPIHVLVIDDSAVVRQVLRELISHEPDMTVSVAGDPIIADKKIRTQRPDVVILDLELPVMDGLTWLRRQMTTDPIPVIVCSARVGDAAVPTIRALEEGAVDVVPKPRLGVRDFLLESRDPLIGAIRAAAGAHVQPRPRAPIADDASRPTPLGVTSRIEPARRVATPPRPTTEARIPARRAEIRPAARVIAIGASTGGPQAVQAVLSALPVDAPGVVVVQHMSGVFTPAFARRLSDLCTIEVREAREGDRVVPGIAWIAPGGQHMELRVGPAGEQLIHLHSGAMVRGHRPSVDVLFRSLTRTSGASTLAVLLTGMGNDGAQGLLELRRAGAATLVESQESCVVFGMPKAALDLGAAELSLPLPDIPACVLRWIADTHDGNASTAPSLRTPPGKERR